MVPVLGFLAWYCRGSLIRSSAIGWLAPERYSVRECRRLKNILPAFGTLHNRFLAHVKFRGAGHAISERAPLARHFSGIVQWRFVKPELNCDCIFPCAAGLLSTTSDLVDDCSFRVKGEGLYHLQSPALPTPTQWPPDYRPRRWPL